jgi:hypothetical protein
MRSSPKGQQTKHNPLLDPDKLTQTRGDLTTQAKAKNECGLLQKGSKLSTTHCWILTI